MKGMTTRPGSRNVTRALAAATARRVGASQARIETSWSVLEAALDRVNRNGMGLAGGSGTAGADAGPDNARHA
jgi:hypothetical protein